MARRAIPETIPRTDTNIYKDMRSKDRQRSRQSKQSAKYYGYRGVHPAWVGQPFFNISRWNKFPYQTTIHPNVENRSEWLADWGVTEDGPAIWTKRDMYLDRENNIWPLDRRHAVGRRVREKCSFKYDESKLGRRMKQRHAEWGFALFDAEPLVREWAYEHSSFYWEMEERQWDDIEEIWDDQGEKVAGWLDFEEEPFDAWVEDGEIDEVRQQYVNREAEIDANVLEDLEIDDFIDVRLVDIEEMEYFFVFNPQDSVLSTSSAEDAFELVEAG